MAMDATVQIRMDKELKEQVEALYKSMGTTFAEAVRIFATQSLIEQGMPFQMNKRPQAYGIAASYANPALTDLEKDAFARAMDEKHSAV